VNLEFREQREGKLALNSKNKIRLILGVERVGKCRGGGGMGVVLAPRMSR